MRCLDRDRKPAWISRYAGRDAVEVDGRLTGRHKASRTEPEQFWPTVGAARGEAETDVFGQALDYDRTVTIDDPAFNVDESSVLWLDREPTEGDSFDHRVRRVARSGSYTVIAVKRVEASR